MDAFPKCFSCEKTFACNPNGQCWCKEFPVQLPIAEAEHCYCPHCLKVKAMKLMHREDAHA
jgi:hypothetical protein